MPLTQDERRALVELARQAVAAHVRRLPAPRADDATGVLAERRGCFVTLTRGEALRGCIGTFTPRLPLARQIIEMGQAAAQDPRFFTDPILPDELDALTVEVSVLSPLERTDHPADLEVGVHGIYIVQGRRSGCFLPEVASEQGWTAEQFLSYCCAHKAGLSPDAWRDRDCAVYLFTSEKFS